MSKRKPRPPCKRYLQVFNRVCIEGRTLEDVARELNLEFKTVVDVVYRVRNYMRRHGASLVLPNPRIARTINARELYLARLEHQWQQLMQEWYRSQQPQVLDKGSLKKTSDGKEESCVEKTHKTRTGDVRYLVQARAILADIRTICQDRPYARKEQNHVKLLTLKQREDEVDRLLAENCLGLPAPTDAGAAWGRSDSADAA